LGSAADKYKQQNNEIIFLDDYRAWALAWADAGAGDNAFYGTEILTTTNGGQIWNVEQYREENVFLRGIYFFGYAERIVGGVPGQFLMTTDGGLTWNLQILILEYFHIFQ